MREVGHIRWALRCVPVTSVRSKMAIICLLVVGLMQNSKRAFRAGLHASILLAGCCVEVSQAGLNLSTAGTYLKIPAFWRRPQNEKISNRSLRVGVLVSMGARGLLGSPAGPKTANTPMMLFRLRVEVRFQKQT